MMVTLNFALKWLRKATSRQNGQGTLLAADFSAKDLWDIPTWVYDPKPPQPHAPAGDGGKDDKTLSGVGVMLGPPPRPIDTADPGSEPEAPESADRR